MHYFIVRYKFTMLEDFIEEFTNFSSLLFNRIRLFNSNQIIADIIKDHFIVEISVIR